MLSLRDLLSMWGFNSHPFEAYTAENEPRLSEYFVAPPYLDDMIGSAAAMTPALVFGSRGIGKSAIRIYLENICASNDTSQKTGGRSLAITYDDFSKVTNEGIENVTLDKHLKVILGKTVVAALTVIVSSIDEETPTEEKLKLAFPNIDLEILGKLTRRYFNPMTDLQREVAFKGIYSYFRKAELSISDRVNWFQKLWSVARVPLFDTANLVQAVRGKEAIGLAEFGKTDPEKTSDLDVETLINDLMSVSSLAEQLGYDGWYILIDKVDEDQNTDSDAARSAKLISPLLKNLKVLEMRRIGFKFFLWNQIRPLLVEDRVRLDKVRNWEMNWTEKELTAMIDKRLMAYSEGQIKSLNDITDPEVENLYQVILYYSMASPREIVHILDSIFREHARHSDQNDGAMINRESVNRGIDEYCLKRIKDIYPENISRAIISLPASCFTSADVQSTFRISRQAASVRIGKLMDDGYIERTADARSETDPSKAIYQYKFIEKRFERVIERNLADD